MKDLDECARRWTMCMTDAGYAVQGSLKEVPEAPDGVVLQWVGHVPVTREAGRHLYRARILAGLSLETCEDCYSRWWASGRRVRHHCDDCPGPA